MVPEYESNEIREVIEGPYRIIYLIESEQRKRNVRYFLVPRSGFVPKPRVAASATLGLVIFYQSTATRLTRWTQPVLGRKTIPIPPRVAATLGYVT